MRIEQAVDAIAQATYRLRRACERAIKLLPLEHARKGRALPCFPFTPPALWGRLRQQVVPRLGLSGLKVVRREGPRVCVEGRGEGGRR